MGQKKVSILVRCPYFRGYIACKNCSWGKKVSLLERCPHWAVLREEFHCTLVLHIIVIAILDVPELCRE